MPKNLYLLRHAESVEKQVGQPDLDRELTSNGMRQSAQVGGYLLKQEAVIERIFTSHAVRATRTAELLADTLRIALGKIVTTEELYGASPRTFLAFINGLDDDLSSVVCIGHNPEISYLAEFLTRAEIGDMTPAGLTSIRFEVSTWQQAAGGLGELLSYVTPELLDA